jgi:hypothetical protein
MTKGEVMIGGFTPLVVLGLLILVLGMYLPPQLETLLNGATQIALAGQPAVASADGLISFVKTLMP